MGEFSIVTAQVQFWAEIGTVDGGGMGYMDTVEKRKAFPTFEEAEQWLTDQGWIYDDKVLRRVKAGRGYGLARTRRIDEFDKSKWIKSGEGQK
jgi:hypothetical protein